MNQQVCTPAQVFIVFIIIQSVVDAYNGNYNISMAKLLFMVVYTLFLSGLCYADLYYVAWIFVFVPFALLSLMIVTLLYIAKMKPTSGRAQTEDELVVPVIVLPNARVIRPINNCIVVTSIAPPKHGIRTQAEDEIFCLS